jgi:hypothetical protein
MFLWTCQDTFDLLTTSLICWNQTLLSYPTFTPQISLKRKTHIPHPYSYEHSCFSHPLWKDIDSFNWNNEKGASISIWQRGEDCVKQCLIICESSMESLHYGWVFGVQEKP